MINRSMVWTRISLALGSLLIAGGTLSAGCAADVGESPPAPEPVSQAAEDLVSPPPAVPPFAGEGAPEPEMAIGLHYLYALSSSTFRVYKRNPDSSINTASPVVAPGTPLSNIFDPVIAKLNASLTYPAATGIPSCTMTTANNGATTASNVGCIATPYDADVYYDVKRDRFWIMTHLRPPIWKCSSDATHTTVNDGFFTGLDPQPGSSPGGILPVCHPNNGNAIARRFIAVAVSKNGVNSGGSADGEDPGNGFFTYVLVDDYGDWPQMMVNGDWLLLNTRDPITQNRTFVFNADSLATNANNIDKSVLTVPAFKYTAADFNVPAVDWTNSVNVNVNVTTPTFFVKQQGDSDGLTYMAAGAGNKLVVYALQDQNGNPALKPLMIQPSLIDLGVPVPENPVPPAWANNELYWAWSDGATSNGAIRAFRVPVHHALHTWNGGHPVFTSKVASDGYLEADVGMADVGHNYALPVMNVNQTGDVVMEYSRFALNQSPPEFPSLRYAVLYHDQTGFSSSQLFGVGTGIFNDNKGLPVLPGGGGVIDVASVVPDPISHTQIFMSDAFATSFGYSPVITAVNPGACANDTAPTQVFTPQMVGCGGSVTYANRLSLCGPGYVPCSSYDWRAYSEGSTSHAPTSNYWTQDNLGYSGAGPNSCEATTFGGTSCGATNPMRVCTPSGTDSFGNTCTWTGCGLNDTNNAYFGGCVSNPTAGTLCCGF